MTIFDEEAIEAAKEAHEYAYTRGQPLNKCVSVALTAAEESLRARGMIIADDKLQKTYGPGWTVRKFRLVPVEGE